MKVITKMFSAAVAVAALASCSSDDLNLGQDFNGEIKDLSQMVGMLDQSSTTRTGMVDNKVSTAKATYPIVWSAGDEVNVYSLSDKLTFNTYSLTSGDGTPLAKFSTDDTNIDLTTNQNLYAVTSSNMVYGVSAQKQTDGTQLPLLTTQVPIRYDATETAAKEDNAGMKYYTNDAPYWGPVSGVNAEGQMVVGFRKLMGAIKIDATMLPKGTKAIVVASSKAAQPLSGTFNAVLNTSAAEEDVYLKADAQLVNYNYIRADFDALTGEVGSAKGVNNKIIIVPLACGHYDKLTVIAIRRDKGDTGFTSASPVVNIPAEGTIVDRGTEGMDKDYVLLREYEDKDVNNQTVIEIYPAVAQTLDNMTPMQISEQIALAYDGKHDFIFNITNIKMDDSYVITGTSTTLSNDNTIYIPKNIEGEGTIRNASIELNFDDNFKTGTEAKLYIKEANYNGKTLVKNETDESKDTRGELIGHNTGTANTQNSYTDATAAGITTTDDASATSKRNVTINLTKPGSGTTCPVDIYLPTTRVTLGTLGADAYDAEIDAIAEVSNTISNTGKTAGLNVVGNFTKVVALANHDGGTIVKGDVTVTELELQNTEAGLVKVDDASVATINYSATQTLNTYVYTVGSAAIKTLTDGSDKVRVRAFWTGKALTADQITANYDQTTIYTAAQLASMGQATAHNASYEISGQVSQMHLGGSAYPWVGATIDYTTGTTNAFTFDGNGVGLRSMVLDPTAASDNLGLIKSVKTSDQAVTIKNIDLYQAVLTTNGTDNIGAVVGKIEAGSGAVSFEGTQNSIKEIDLTAAGDNIGGVFGYVKTTGNFTSNATSNTVLTITKIGGKDNVAGFCGKIEAATVLVDKIINVTATGDITASGSQVGGLFGNVEATGDFKINSKTALDLKKVTAASINAGGIAGFYKADGTNTFVGSGSHANSVTVKATEISAELNNVGGLFGNADKCALTVGRTTDANGAAVTVEVTKIAGAYHVGGLVGLSNVAVTVYGKKTTSDEEYPVTVKVGSFANTKTADYFSTTELKLACGTFGGMIGKANSTVTIADPTYNIVENATTLLSDTQKAALQFKVNVAEEKDAYGNTQYFWGDTNNFVGYVVEGYDYKVNGEKQTVNTDYNTFKAY